MRPGIMAIFVTVAASVGVHFAASEAQVSSVSQRTLNGRPDLSGVWQAVTEAHWDIEPHDSRQGPVVALGAAFSVPAGAGIVEGGSIPYQPWALEKKRENQNNWLTRDSEIKCYLPGVPRATYMPYPFQIIQSSTEIMISYAFANAVRVLHMNSKETRTDLVGNWMGWSTGRWESNTLVVDVTTFAGDTWFDRAGNFHSDDLHVIERYTPMNDNALQYEATIEDPKVFTRPWKIRLPLYRRLEPDIELLEHQCIPFVEELMYGHLYRK